MSSFASVIRWARGLGSLCLLFISIFALGTSVGFCSSPNPERIQATYTQDGALVSVSLVIYGYTTPSEMQTLSQAFEEGQDQGLVIALSKTKAAGNCSITGEPSLNVAFIQMVLTPTGRQITFITSRPLQSDEVRPSNRPAFFDVMVGQFDINDADNTKSTGFLYLASRLVVDERGEFHYDLAGRPWSLANVLDSK